MKDEAFAQLIKSIKQAGEIQRGERLPSRVFEFGPLDVKAIRARLHKSQSEFAQMIGVSIATLQNWEQGRRKPEGPARALLQVALYDPEAVRKALSTDLPVLTENCDCSPQIQPANG
jgi:putative transcriptional regulator